MKIGKYNYEIIGDYLMCDENLFIRIDKISHMDINQESAYIGVTYQWKYYLRIWDSDGNVFHSTDRVSKHSELIDLVKMIANYSKTNETIDI